MRPTPPTLITVLEATIFDLCCLDWKQRTTFPLAKVALRDPTSQLLKETTYREDISILSIEYGDVKLKLRSKFIVQLFYLALSLSESLEVISSANTIE